MKHLFIACFLNLSFITFVSAEQTYTLKFDPFKNQNKPKATNISTTKVPVQATKNNKNWTAKVTSIIQAGNNSMANIDGNIISLGEQYKSYTLIEIKRKSVVFQKGSHKITLGLDANE